MQPGATILPPIRSGPERARFLAARRWLTAAEHRRPALVGLRCCAAHFSRRRATNSIRSPPAVAVTCPGVVGSLTGVIGSLTFVIDCANLVLVSLTFVVFSVTFVIGSLTGVVGRGTFVVVRLTVVVVRVTFSVSRADDYVCEADDAASQAEVSKSGTVDEESGTVDAASEADDYDSGPAEHQSDAEDYESEAADHIGSTQGDGSREKGYIRQWCVAAATPKLSLERAGRCSGGAHACLTLTRYASGCIQSLTLAMSRSRRLPYSTKFLRVASSLALEAAS